MKSLQVNVVLVPGLDELFLPLIGDGVADLLFREGPLDERVARQIERYARHITDTGMIVQLDDGRTAFTGICRHSRWMHLPDRFEIHMERAGENVLAKLWTFRPHITGQHSLLYLVRNTLVSPDLPKEFNATSDAVGVVCRGLGAGPVADGVSHPKAAARPANQRPGTGC